MPNDSDTVWTVVINTPDGPVYYFCETEDKIETAIAHYVWRWYQEEVYDVDVQYEIATLLSDGNVNQAAEIYFETVYEEWMDIQGQQIGLPDYIYDSAQRALSAPASVQYVFERDGELTSRIIDEPDPVGEIGFEAKCTDLLNDGWERVSKRVLVSSEARTSLRNVLTSISEST
jgi:hypothetical protein